MTLSDYLRSFRARWRLVVSALLLGLLAGGLIAARATPQYTSTTQFFVSASPTATSDAYTGNLFSEERATSYVQVLTGVQLARAVADDLHLDLSPDEIAGEVSAAVVPDTVILDVSVTDVSAARAHAIAQAMGSAFSRLVDSLETPSGTAASPVKVTVLTPASQPSAPSAPNIPLDLALGALAGLVIGMFAALMRERADTRLRSTDEAGTLAQAPVLGIVVEDASLLDHRPLTSDSSPAVGESFRQVRTNLDYVGVDTRPQVVLVTSSVPGEGKSTVATSLAVVLAETGKKVLLIEADVRRPRVTEYLRLVGGAGLTNVLTGAASLDAVVQEYGPHGLEVLAAGPTPPNPSELLSSAAMRQLLEHVRSRYDMVVVDGPPLLPVADAGALAPLTDGVLLITGWGTVRREEIERSRRALQQVGRAPLGVVVSRVPPRAASAQGYGYGYGYGAAPESPQHPRVPLWRRSRRRRSAPPASPSTPVRTPSAVRQNLQAPARSTGSPQSAGRQ